MININKNIRDNKDNRNDNNNFHHGENTNGNNNNRAEDMMGILAERRPFCKCG